MCFSAGAMADSIVAFLNTSRATAIAIVQLDHPHCDELEEETASELALSRSSSRFWQNGA